MLSYSKSFRSIRTRTENLYDRARKKLTSSFRGERRHKVSERRRGNHSHYTSESNNDALKEDETMKFKAFLYSLECL